MPRAIAVLQEMYDWHGVTSAAGYTQAPKYFRINPKNLTGSRLYWLLGPTVKLLCTDACPQLVRSARERGVPDSEWLHTNLIEMTAFPDTQLVLVCGRVAIATYRQASIPHGVRIVEMPHPAARTWNRRSLDYARRVIQEGTIDVELRFKPSASGPRLVATRLIPF